MNKQMIVVLTLLVLGLCSNAQDRASKQDWLVYYEHPDLWEWVDTTQEGDRTATDAFTDQEHCVRSNGRRSGESGRSWFVRVEDCMHQHDWIHRGVSPEALQVVRRIRASSG